MVSTELEDPTPLDFAWPKLGLGNIKGKKSSMLKVGFSQKVMARLANDGFIWLVVNQC